MKRIFALKFSATLFCLLALVLVSCGAPATGGPQTGAPTTPGGDKAPENQQIYINPYEALPDLNTLDPALVTDLYSAQAINMLFNGLVELNNKGEVVPVLAESYKTSEDGLTWTFTLRDNLKFSDGSPLTSDDVVFSINRALDPDTKSTYGPYYLGLVKDSDKIADGSVDTLIGTSLQNPDPRTVVIQTNKPAAYFLYTITFQTAYVVQKSAVEKYGNDFTQHLEAGGGSGPWIVSSYERGKEIIFTPNTHYFGKKPQLKKVVRPFYEESDVTWRAYGSNQLHKATVPIANLAQAKALPDAQYHRNLALNNGYVTFNYLAKPFDNIKIRQAFALAVNKDLIVNNIYKGVYVASHHIIPEGMPGYNPNLVGPAGVTSTAGDPEKAKQILQEGLTEAGYASIADLPPIVLTTATGGSADARNVNAAIQQMWKSVLGIDVKIDDIDFNKLLDEVTGTTSNANLQAWAIGWIADYPDPQNWTSVQFGNKAGNNNLNYGQNESAAAAKQQENQKLMDTADANPNPQERLQQYQQIEQQLVEEVAWLVLYQQASAYVEKPCVKGVVPTAFLVTPPDDWADVYISTASNCAVVTTYQ